MATVCVIGLPVQLRARLEGAFRAAHLTLSALQAGPGKEGVLWLLPHPGEVIPLLHQYVDGLPQYSDASVVVLPYVRIPQNLLSEIAVLEEAGARVIRPNAGKGAWPILASDREFDEQFRDTLFRALTDLLVPGAVPRDLPSAYFVSVCGRNPNLLLASTVLRRCDAVTEDRYDFMRDAADAFDELLQGDPGMPLEDFFKEKKLEHAQSGDINAKVTIRKNGQQVYTDTTYTHLKCGDATSRASAARIFYHRFVLDGVTFIAVLHAGPHPDRGREIKVVIEI